jgi:archaellum biogenesis ATPase FlaH
LDLAQRRDISESDCRNTVEFITKSIKENKQDLEWLIDSTEKFCQDKAIFNAVYSSIKVLEDKSGKKPRTIIPSLLQDALAVSFDTDIGHDFLDNASDRFEFYHAVEERIPFDIDMLNTITKGGVPKKTLNMLMGGVGFGKTLWLCHFAATNLLQGRNVLYITMEMAEERIAERIDANLLDIELNDLMKLDQARFEQKVAALKEKTVGKLIIKEYPTAGAGVNSFRHLLHELRVKKNFKPDIIYIDYLNLCISSRIKFSANVNTYVYVKFIAEEIRGLAVEYNVPVWSATQLNREGFKSSDPGMDDTSESFGLPATCDLFGVIVPIPTDLEQMQYKQLKNRYTDHMTNTKFNVGVARDYMRLFNIEAKGQPGNLTTTSVPTSTAFQSSKKLTYTNIQ